MPTEEQFNAPPLVQTWNRLEGRARKRDFNKAFRAEVRDPLWLLSRQWQMGEFQGEDAGSPVFVRGELKTTRMNQMAPNSETVIPLSESIPLEVKVEQEPIVPDLSLRVEMGQHWFRILHKKLAAAGKLKDLYDADFRSATAPVDLKFELPESSVATADLFSNPDLAALLAAVAGRGIDGAALYRYLQGSTQASDFLASTDTAVDAAGDDFVAWYRRTFLQPEVAAWDDQQLEYNFAVSGPLGSTGNQVLEAAEYYHGTLDWYAFDQAKSPEVYPPALRPASPGLDALKKEDFVAIPTEVRYPGMPHARWWEMEEGRGNLGVAEMGANETARMIISDFTLNGSEDWLVVPVRMGMGKLGKVEELVVRDVFGQETLLKPVDPGAGSEREKWSLFQLADTDPDDGYAFYLPDVLSGVQESEPVESVAFFRDEMANLIWAVEKHISNGVGGGQEGQAAGFALKKYIEGFGSPKTETISENTATIQYKMAGSVPENWIPFVPVHTGEDKRGIQLQRTAMPRIVPGLNPTRVLPRTGILSGPTSPYFIHEESIPRAGIVVSKHWQRVRGPQGQIFTWLGRKKKTGRGGGSSGLAFDAISPKEA